MRLRRPLALLAAVCLFVAPLRPNTGDAAAASTSAVARSATSPPVLIRRVVIGHSRKNRPIVAYEIGDRRLPSVLVVGCIHGNETAGVAVTRWLVSHARGVGRIHLWVVPVLHPDGVALRTRQNAAGVDLNRNFPYRWVRADRGGLHDSGPRVLSEPEAR